MGRELGVSLIRKRPTERPHSENDKSQEMAAECFYVRWRHVRVRASDTITGPSLTTTCGRCLADTGTVEPGRRTTASCSRIDRALQRCIRGGERRICPSIRLRDQLMLADAALAVGMCVRSICRIDSRSTASWRVLHSGENQAFSLAISLLNTFIPASTTETSLLQCPLPPAPFPAALRPPGSGSSARLARPARCSGTTRT